MRAVSLFSGAGGFELGFQRAGIETVLQVEIDPVCLSVLERHWPETERVDDVRQVDAAALQGRCRDVVGVGSSADTEWLGGTSRGVAGAGDRRRRARDNAHGGSAGRPREWRQTRPGLSGDIDLVYGGFPCQDVSVAGQRAGLRGERSGLWYEFHRVLSELRPRWMVVENVPGLLSSGAEPGADFGVVLRGLVDLGYGVAWRVLDARWFGVPQRRRRVFIVGCLGDAPRAAQVLAVCESCGGDPETGGETGQDIAYSLAASARGTGDQQGNAWNTTYLPMTADVGGRVRSNLRSLALDVVHAFGGNNTSGEINLASGRSSRANRYDFETDTFLVNTAAAVRRLTPLESERLMGWPERQENLIIRVCSDRPKNRVPAATPNRKSPAHAGSVGAIASNERASFAATTSLPNDQRPTAPVEVHAVWSCEDGSIAITIPQAGSPLHVSSAASRDWFARRGLAVDSVQLAAAMTSILLRTTLGGVAESPLSEMPSLAQHDGNRYVGVSGQEITDAANGAELSIVALRGCLKSTTLPVGQSSLTSDSILRTLSCYVAAVTSAFIPEAIRSAGSYDVRASFSSGHTRYAADGREIPDSHRYRLCGNGVVATVAEWIGHRLVRANCGPD